MAKTLIDGQNFSEVKPIGIVTVLYNSEKVLKPFFDSLNNQSYSNLTLYVINNASPDKSKIIVEEQSPKTRFPIVLIDVGANVGVAAGNNIGIKRALKDGCEFVLLSNNDIELHPNAISILIDGMAENNASMVVPKIINFFTNNIWAAGGKFLYFRGTTKHIGAGDAPDRDIYNITKEVNYSPTCFMLIKRGVFERVGLMDETYFVYSDDTDFVWRATIIGNERLFYIPNSVIWHKESTCTEGIYSDFTLRYMIRNNVYFSFKYYNIIHLMLLVPYHITKYLFKYCKILNRHQRDIVRKAYKEGFDMYFNNRK